MTGISRRTLLGGSLAAAAVSLSGCSTVTRSTDIAALNKPVALPTYKRFDGPKPDLPRSHPLMPDCFYRFPEHPAKVTDGVPGDGSDVSGSMPTSNPIPPTADRNPYWQELNRRLGSPLSADDHLGHGDRLPATSSRRRWPATRWAICSTSTAGSRICRSSSRPGRRT